MGMYDREPNLDDKFPMGTPFIVWGGDYQGLQGGAGGLPPNHKAIVTVSDPKTPQAKENVVIWGVRADMIRRAGSEDFPHVARCVQDGNSKVFEHISDEVFGAESPV